MMVKQLKFFSSVSQLQHNTTPLTISVTHVDVFIVDFIHNKQSQNKWKEKNRSRM